jgi:hypothetical protein
MKYSCLSRDFTIISQPSDCSIASPPIYLIVLSSCYGELSHSFPEALFPSMPPSRVRMYSQATKISLCEWSKAEQTMLETLFIESGLHERHRLEIMIDIANINFSSAMIISILRFVESCSSRRIAISIGCSTAWAQSDIKIMYAILKNTKASMTVYLEPRKFSGERKDHLISQNWLVYLLSELASIWGNERISPLTSLE